MKITVQTKIQAPLAIVWDAWVKPEHIVNWAFASPEWEAPEAENDLQVGGHFKTIMSAKDKSESFDFTGVYTALTDHALIEYKMDDGRMVKIEFRQLDNGVEIIESFDPEKENSEEMQKAGWQAILDNFKIYVEIKLID